MYVGAHLRNMSELEPFMAFIKKEALMPEPILGMSQFETGEPAKLSSLDYRIIHALHKDSRKRVTEVAGELGVSAKTVQRRLSRMTNVGHIELSLEWYPDKSNDIMTILHLNMKASADKGKLIPRLMTEYSPNVVHIFPFSNLPNTALGVIWTNTMKELQDIRKRLEDEGSFESVQPNVLHSGYLFDTWRDRILRKKGSKPE
jgi:DNA-binding Lrp family transcriptional regulator